MKAIILAGAVALFPVVATAQQLQCSTQQGMKDALKKQFGEELLTVGVDTANRLVEIYANLRKGTWTIVMTPPGQPSCIVGDGHHMDLKPQGEAL